MLSLLILLLGKHLKHKDLKQFKTIKDQGNKQIEAVENQVGK